jgi:hypothetical protein
VPKRQRRSRHCRPRVPEPGARPLPGPRQVSKERSLESRSVPCSSCFSPRLIAKRHDLGSSCVGNPRSGERPICRCPQSRRANPDLHCRPDACAGCQDRWLRANADDGRQGCLGNRVGRIEGELPDPLAVGPATAALARVVNATSTRWTLTTEHMRWIGRTVVSMTQE